MRRWNLLWTNIRHRYPRNSSNNTRKRLAPLSSRRLLSKATAPAPHVPLVHSQLACTITGHSLNYLDFSIGCYPLEALLQSSLLCLFNTTRVQLLDAYFPSLTTAALHLQVLSTNRSSHYESNTTVESFPNQLLVEQWITKSSYDAYYAQCAPRTCIFTYVRRSNPLVLVTTV